MANIKQITLPSGTTYDIVDQGARDLIDALAGYTVFLGVTTTALMDGSTTNPITIDGKSITATAGAISTFGSAEFIFNGTSWQAFGDLSGLGALAYKDSASSSYTPAGNVTQPTFSLPSAEPRQRLVRHLLLQVLLLLEQVLVLLTTLRLVV